MTQLVDGSAGDGGHFTRRCAIMGGWDLLCRWTREDWPGLHGKGPVLI